VRPRRHTRTVTPAPAPPHHRGRNGARPRPHRPAGTVHRKENEMIEVGKKAPAFSLKDQDGNTHKLADYAGRWLVLYFYPKDSTPGCTTEACEFTDSLKKFEKLDAAVLGCSADDAKSHEKFIAKYKLKFPLLSDPTHATMEKYDAWGEKNMYGKKMMGVIRSTVLIDPAGKVARHWKKVKAAGHAEEVRKALAELKAA